MSEDGSEANTNDYWLRLDKQFRIQSRATYPMCWAKGDGVRLWDVEGKSYLDFEAGQACVATGHSHPSYVAAVQAQAATLMQTGSAYTDPVQVKLLQKIAEITPAPFQKSFLACSGAESNEAALRLAKAHSGRFEICSLVGNNHGATFGSWSTSGMGGNFRAPYGPAMPGVTFLPTPFTYPTPGFFRHPEREPEVVEACLRFCEMLLDETTSGAPAAMMVELVQSAASMRVLPPLFVQGLRRICDERGSLLIVDEALSGMGRLGKWWAFEFYDIVPDILTAAKMLGGGVPLSAVITSERIADEAVQRGYRQSSSHTGDPLLAAAGLANIEIIERENLLQNVRETGAHLKAGLEAIASSSPILGEIRGMGLLLGVEVVRSKDRGEPNTEAAEAIARYSRDSGLLMGWIPGKPSGANVIRLMPPFTLTKADADQALRIVEEAVHRTGRLGAS